MASTCILRHARRIVAAIALAALMPLLGACDLFGNEPPLEEVAETVDVGHGPCIPTYGRQVLAADMNAAGSRILFLTASKPGTLPEEQGWGSDDRALVVLDFAGDGSANSRHIATGWSARAAIEPYATEEPDQTRSNEIDLPEQMVDLDMDADGGRFVVGVKQRGSIGTFSGLYQGSIPASGTSNLDPEEGLSPVEIISPSGIEGVSNFWLSPDGSRVAAIVGTLNELRVYDLDAESDNLSVYELGQDGEVVVDHEMPEASTSIEVGHRRPAYASKGTIRAVWAPNSRRLALVRHQSDLAVGRSTLEIVDTDSGASELVGSYDVSTAPHVAWAADGASLWVMRTPIGSASDTPFGDAQIRHVEAAEGGAEIGPGASLPRPLGWRSDPGSLTVFQPGQSLIYSWENRIYRLDLTGGDLAGAESAYLLLRQRVPQDLRVLPDDPVASADADRVMFLVQDAGGMRIAIRDHAGQDNCPLDQAVEESGEAEEGEAAPEGEAGEESGTEDGASEDGSGDSSEDG